MNAVDRLLANPSFPQPRSAVASCGRVAVSGVESVGEEAPQLAANMSAMELLRTMAEEMRASREEITKLREHAAKLDGMELTKRLDAHAGRMNEFQSELNVLKAKLLADTAQRKPWVFIGGEVLKLALAALAGAFALSKLPH